MWDLEGTPWVPDHNRLQVRRRPQRQSAQDNNGHDHIPAPGQGLPRVHLLPWMCPSRQHGKALAMPLTVPWSGCGVKGQAQGRDEQGVYCDGWAVPGAATAEVVAAAKAIEAKVWVATRLLRDDGCLGD